MGSRHRPQVLGKSRPRSSKTLLAGIGLVALLLQLSVLGAYRGGLGFDATGVPAEQVREVAEPEPPPQQEQQQQPQGGAEHHVGGSGGRISVVPADPGTHGGGPTVPAPEEGGAALLTAGEEGEEAGEEPDEGGGLNKEPAAIDVAPFVRDAGSLAVDSRSSLTDRQKALVLVGRHLLASPEYGYPTDRLILTQANHKKLRPRDSVKRVNLLPASHPNLTYSSCALVGNAGGLLAARHGPEIDRHEVVMRVNQGPTKGYEFHVGGRVTFRLINKKWASVYASKLEGQAILLPKEKANTTFIVTRASKWAFERLAAVVRRERPDLRVLYLANGPVSRARWMLKAFRAASTELGGNFTRGDAPSSGMIGMYLLLQMCDRVTVYGLGQALPDVSASRAFTESVQWAPKHVRLRCVSSNMTAKAARAHGYHDMSRVSLLLPRHPYPYHYFFNYPDSWQLRAHPHHDFDCETELMHVLSLGSGESSSDGGFCFCPPPPPHGCTGSGRECREGHKQTGAEELSGHMGL